MAKTALKELTHLNPNGSFDKLCRVFHLNMSQVTFGSRALFFNGLASYVYNHC